MSRWSRTAIRMTGLDELLTADEVAELLHITRSTVSDYARRGVLPSIKLGRHRRFVCSDVADAIERLRLAHARSPNQSRQRRTTYGYGHEEVTDLPGNDDAYDLWTPRRQGLRLMAPHQRGRERWGRDATRRDARQAY
jgi:excisionase family DNA binding protein